MDVDPDGAVLLGEVVRQFGVWHQVKPHQLHGGFLWQRVTCAGTQCPARNRLCPVMPILSAAASCRIPSLSDWRRYRIARVIRSWALSDRGADRWPTVAGHRWRGARTTCPRGARDAALTPSRGSYSTRVRPNGLPSKPSCRMVAASSGRVATRCDQGVERRIGRLPKPRCPSQTANGLAARPPRQRPAAAAAPTPPVLAGEGQERR
jgi:hypothetical protein